MASYNDITLWMEEHKLRALLDALGDREALGTEMNRRLEALYQEAVPADKRAAIDGFLEDQKRKEAEEQARLAAERYRVSAVRIVSANVHTGEKADQCWKMERDWSVLDMARLLRTALRQNALPPDQELLRALKDAQEITREEFERIAADKLGGDAHVTTVCTLDFMRQLITMYKRQGAVCYGMRDVSTAIYQADRRSGVRNESRMYQFSRHLDGKAVDSLPPETGAEAT